MCVTSQHSVGCSFLDWSINFLSGKENFFNIKRSSWIPLSKNPVGNLNAHGHKKNHPHGYSATVEYLNEFLKTSSDLHTMYPSTLYLDDACNDLGINHCDLSNQYSVVKEYQCQDYDKLINYCLENNVKVIYVHDNLQALGYFWNIRQLDRQLLKQAPYKNLDQADAEYQNLFLKDNKQHWSDVENNYVWDTRECLALNIRPFELINFNEIGITKPHLWIDCQDLWHSTNSVLIQAMNFVGVEIDSKRWADWLPVMKQWQDIQHKNLKFHYALDHIVSSIVNNWYYPLEKLTLMQEAIIQHCLIYKHNLNLKNWNLFEFPNNTQKLHKLLETNIHDTNLFKNQ